ncbi:acetyltransferase (GNAT) family domain-containing protein [Ditylenchus destructor]|uniref:Acetyltransferase (GNAT) family domain-containing protein n=1 Tax=Ditylenchus destructor TaxID=166010 RepID=A0AAD4MGK0_9BILA|nr:acetyltransferase (GNAT) family domain-containing protein [Ditylenchus destructor]
MAVLSVTFALLLTFLGLSIAAPPPGAIEKNTPEHQALWTIYYKIGNNRIGNLDFDNPGYGADVFPVHSISIHDCNVDTGYRKQGVATKLVRYLIDQILRKYPDILDVHLNVKRGHSNEGAIALYLSVGFQWDVKDKSEREKEGDYGMTLAVK